MKDTSKYCYKTNTLKTTSCIYLLVYTIKLYTGQFMRLSSVFHIHRMEQLCWYVTSWQQCGCGPPPQLS